MCIIEIWTYVECGCHFENLVPCHHSSDNLSSEPPLDPPYSCQNDYDSPLSPSQIQLPPSPSATDQEDDRQEKPYEEPASMFRYCSIRHTIRKTFLEPICDECLLEELKGQKRYTDNGNVVTHDDFNDEGRGPNGNAKRKNASGSDTPYHFEPILESNIEITIEQPTSTNDCSSFDVKHLADALDRISEDADDEKSFDTFSYERSHRTKQLHRKGFDISRQSLRISLDVSARTRTVIEDIRRTVVQRIRPSVDRFQRKSSKTETNSRCWTERIICDTKRNTSQADPKVQDLEKRSAQYRQNKMRKMFAKLPATSSITKVDKHENGNAQNSVNVTKSFTGVVLNTEPDHDLSFHDELFSEMERCWQQHLEHDLAESDSVLLRTAQKKKKPTSNYSQVLTSPSKVNIRQGVQSSNEQESYVHLHESSVANSISMAASSTATASWSQPGERLDNVLTSGDFDGVAEDETVNAQMGQQSSIITIIDDSGDEQVSRRGSGIDRSDMLDLLKTHHGHKSAAAADNSALHPVHTLISTSTEGFGLRNTDSLRPLSQFSCLQDQTQNTKYVCIWERYCCSVCGKFIRERVKSCACEMENRDNSGLRLSTRRFHSEMLCRAELPIVRYIYEEDQVPGDQTEKQAAAMENASRNARPPQLCIGCSETGLKGSG